MNKLICIVCPKGCHLTVDDKLNVSGNSCKRGAVYGANEVVNPTRTITSTVNIKNGIIARLPVITSKPIPKNMIFKCMEVIHKTTITAPVATGEVVIPNILSLDVDIVASREVKAK